jgi:AraC-like DNA-binding protein
MFHLAGILLSLFLALLLFTKKGKTTADLILAGWLSLISFHLFAYYLLISNTYVGFPYLLGLEIPIPLIHGPILYVYVATLTHQKSKKLPWFIHFIPAIAAYVLLAGFFSLSIDQKIYVYQNQGIGYEKLSSLIHLPIIPSGIFYVILSLILLKNHRQNIGGQFSYSEKINLNWLIYLTAGMGIIWLSVIFGNDTSTFILVDVFILIIGYFGIKQVGIFTNLAPEAEKTKYQKSGLSDETSSIIYQQLTQLMLVDQLYKDPELSLDELAERLGVHSNRLSQVINSVAQRNFYDYINDLRVQEFKRLVALPANNKFTLLAVAFEAGFNSKTSFNRNFKKATGLSPSAYCQQAQINQSPIKEPILPFGT